MSEEAPPFLGHLVGAFAIVLLQIGHRTGLLAAVLDRSGTAGDIAARAGADPRNAEEWLRGMTVAGYLSHDDGRFAPTEMTAMTFGARFPVTATAVLDGLWVAPQLYDDIVAAVRSGEGIASDRLTAYAPFADVNSPTYAQALVGDWLDSVPGLTERLTSGARVAEIAPGNGAAAGIVGRAFPASTVVGYDLEPREPVALPDNVRIVRADARDLPHDGPFDLVYCLDSLHHMGDPATVLAGVRPSLARGGVMLLAENDLTGDLDVDAENPSSVIAFASSVMYCLQEALHGGGEVHSCAEGTRWVVDALERAGYRDVTVHHSEDTGYAIFSGLA